uniref:Uncharacterized protein n=1 Tax=Lotus japonicus TaxID=34305 RepID=I3SFE5_LOTJA|nr:unknown [Lotus japonicus]
MIELVECSSTLESELGAAPVPTLRIIPDGVVSPHADPVRDGPVLPHLLGQLLLDPERLVGRHLRSEPQQPPSL